MAETWNHPTLGPFAFEGMGWTKVVDLPSFKACSYDTGYSNAPRSTGKHPLTFPAAFGERDVPSPARVALAERVVANQAALVDAVAAALWEDFNGRGPGSGMWWHGDLAFVAKSWKGLKLPPPAKPADVLAALQLARIIMRDGFPNHPVDPIVELAFHSAFEPEHGVSILTDGQSILGVGYNLDVMPFDYKPVFTRRFG